MKKVLALVLFGGISLSLHGSEGKFDKEAHLVECKVLVQQAILDFHTYGKLLKDALQQGKELRAAHNISGSEAAELLDMKFSDANEKQVFRPTVDQVLARLDSPLFGNVQNILQILNPRYTKEAGSSDDWSEIVALIITDFINGDLGYSEFAYNIVEYACSRHGICVDEYDYVDDDETGSAENVLTLGQVLDDKEMTFPYKDRLVELVKPFRNREALHEFDEEKFKDAVFNCLWEKTDLEDLKKYLSSHKVPSNGYGSIVVSNGLSLEIYLRAANGYDSRFYTRKPAILAELGIKSQEKEFVNPKISKEDAGKKLTTDAMKYFFDFPDDKINFGNAAFLYRKFPLDLDATYDDGRTFGQALAHKQGYRLGKKFAKVVAKYNKTYRPPHALLDLLVVGLIHENFNAYGDLRNRKNKPDELLPFRHVQKVRRPVLIKKHFGELGVRKVTVREFVDTLDLEMFPFRSNIEYYAFDNFLKPQAKIDSDVAKKKQKDSINDLIIYSLTSKELVPLVKYACERYRQLHGEDVGIELGKIHYVSGKSVGEYLIKNRSIPQYAEYKKLFPSGYSWNKSSKSRKHSKKNSASKVGKSPNSNSMLRNMLIAGVVGVAGFALYQYRQKLDEKTDVQVI